MSKIGLLVLIACAVPLAYSTTQQVEITEDRAKALESWLKMISTNADDAKNKINKSFSTLKQNVEQFVIGEIRSNYAPRHAAGRQIENAFRQFENIFKDFIVNFDRFYNGIVNEATICKNAVWRGVNQLKATTNRAAVYVQARNYVDGSCKFAYELRQRFGYLNQLIREHQSNIAAFKETQAIRHYGLRFVYLYGENFKRATQNLVVE